VSVKDDDGEVAATADVSQCTWWIMGKVLASDIPSMYPAHLDPVDTPRGEETDMKKGLLALVVVWAAFAGCGGGGDGKQDAGQLTDRTGAGDQTPLDLSGEESRADSGAPDDGLTADVARPDEVVAEEVAPDNGDQEIDEPVMDMVRNDAGETTQPQSCTMGDNACDEGEKCVPDEEGTALVCVTAGDRAVSETCGSEGVDDCVAGAVCVAWDDEFSFCQALCTGETNELPCAFPGALCIPWAEELGLGYCLGDDCTPPATGCAAGLRCSVMMASVFACVPEGPVPLGGDCAEEECVAGAKCVAAELGGYFCTALCHLWEGCPEPGFNCHYLWDALPEWGLCSEGCDPIEQTGCDPGESCYFEDPEIGSFLCWDTGDLPVGADCSSMTEFCVPGSDCFLDQGSEPLTYSCRAFCDDEHPCQEGTCQESPLVKGTMLCL